MSRGVFYFHTLLLSAAAASSLHAAPTTDAALARSFESTAKPFLAAYCLGCHGGEKPAAQFDLKPYTTYEAVVRDHAHWSHILTRVSAGEMPPKPMKQPPAPQRAAFLSWIRDLRAHEARKNSGDPGPVLARRLSNAEYNYTIRDLTGADLRPTREFPVDPANPEGFDNTGESLTMSPALLNKYLQAAREVANHAVLTPDSIDFAGHPMLVETDREKYAIQRIVNFYFSQPTDYADYFAAAWRFKHRAALGQPDATLDSLATSSKLSKVYLPLVWEILGEGVTEPEVGPILKLRTLWRALPAPAANGAFDDKALRAQCVAMRDWVKQLRARTARQFAAPFVARLSPTSQPLMNWKLRAFAASRRDFDRDALRLASDPPLTVPAIPRYPGLGRESAVRAAALMVKSRIGDPDLIVPDGQRAQYEDAFARFSHVFPDVFFISERGRFFPDDSQDKGRLLSAGYHNVMGYFRDDQPLMELILDDAGRQRLNRLWTEFDFIAEFTARTWVQYFFNQSGEVEDKGRESGSVRPSDKEVSATPVIMGLREAYLAKARAVPTNDPLAIPAIEYHFKWVDETLRSLEKLHADAEPKHVDALLAFAARAYRRPLTDAERSGIVRYYAKLREKDALTHEEAIRDSLVTILISPKFCYRLDSAASPATSSTSTRAPLSGPSLASRLSYFLWASMPDDKLLTHAASGDLNNPTVLAAEARRLLADPRVRGFATEFAGNWLDFRRFETHNAVDRGRFPSFDNDLRQAMFEEPIRFVEDIIRRNRSILDLLYAKDTFVNAPLAKHYGIPNPPAAGAWTHIADASPHGRGGLLPMSVFLTQNAPGLRTSPVKRGYWVVRRVLGEVIPPPPPNVPELPADEAKSDLPLRDMLAKHRDNPACASCHSRFDSFGLAFEGYGPIGERRDNDLAGRPVQTTADFPNGAQGSGYEAVLRYIQQNRERDFVDNLCRKLLAFALGRSLILSDEEVLERMKQSLAANGNRFSALVEPIVTSEQFRNRRVASAQ